MSSFPAPAPPPTPPQPSWWKRKPFLGMPVWGLIAVGVFVVGGLVLSVVTKGGDDDTTTPTVPSGTEACAALRDPANGSLTASDWRRIGDWTQGEMVAYVTDHCPDQLSKVQR